MRFILAVSLLTSALGACSSDNGSSRATPSSPHNPTVADAAVPSHQPVAITAATAQPYFSTGSAGAAARAFAAEDWRAARDGFAAYLDDGSASPSDRAHAGLLIAIADSHLKDWPHAAAGFTAAATALPIIADYCHYQAARAFYFAHDFSAARDHAGKVAADSLSGADAELLIGDLLRGDKKPGAIAAHYQKYLADRPEGIRLAEARYRLAEAEDQLGHSKVALDHYRRITIAAPITKWATLAQQRIDALLPTLGASERKPYQTMNADEYIERGTAYYKAMRNPKSAADFEAALTAPGLTDDSACVAAYHLGDSWFKERNRTMSAPRFDRAIDLCRKTSNVDLLVKAGYQAGRSYARLHKYDIAAARYATAEEDAARNDHSYADDARLRQAEAESERGNDKRATELLANMADLYPDGDMRGEAMWRLAWRAYRKKDYAEAVRWLDKQIATKPLEDKYYAEGQPQYWLGRTYAKLGDRAKSIAFYEETVRKYPLTYYALLALNRLRENHRDRFDAIVAELATAPAGYDPNAPAFVFPARAVYAEPGFARAIEFLRLDLGKPAEAELARLGLTPPDGKERVDDPDLVDKLWAMAFLNDRAGRYQPSHWVTRWHVVDFKRRWPVGKNRARWEIAYPRAFWDLVDKHATAHGYPTALQMAIVREESAFDPLRESWANAIGLTQMIFPTADRFGKGTGIEITRENLRDPEKNVTIGSNFLVFLWKKWDQHIALIPPSYNAGENGVARWLRQRGTLPTDEWAETIPGDQPRRYSKRVLASFFVYTYLGDGSIPVMRNDIPQDIIPKARKRSGKRKKRGKTRETYK